MGTWDGVLDGTSLGENVGVSEGDPVGRFVNETRIWVENILISGIFSWHCVRYLQTDHCTSNWRVSRCIEKTSGT